MFPPGFDSSMFPPSNSGFAPQANFPPMQPLPPFNQTSVDAIQEKGFSTPANSDYDDATKRKKGLFGRVFTKTPNDKKDGTGYDTKKDQFSAFSLPDSQYRTMESDIKINQKDEGNVSGKKKGFSLFGSKEKREQNERARAIIEQNEYDLYNGDLLQELGIDFSKLYKRLYYVINPFAKIPEEIGAYGDMTIIIFIIILYGIAGLIIKRDSLHLPYITKMLLYGMIFFHCLLSVMRNGLEKKRKMSGEISSFSPSSANGIVNNANSMAFNPQMPPSPFDTTGFPQGGFNMGTMAGSNSLSIGLPSNPVFNQQINDGLGFSGNDNQQQRKHKFDFYVTGSAVAYGLLPSIIVTYICVIFNFKLIEATDDNLFNDGRKIKTNYILLAIYILTTCWGSLSATKFINVASSSMFESSKLLVSFPLVLYYLAFVLLEFTYAEKKEAIKNVVKVAGGTESPVA